MPPRKRRKRQRPHGFGTVRQRGAKWEIRWRESGRQRSAQYPSQDTAERVLARIIGDQAAKRGHVEPDPLSVPTLAELAKDWLARRDATHRSADDDRGRWENHLSARLGHLRPDEVDPALLRQIIEDKLASGRLRARGKGRGEREEGKGLSSSTARLLMRLLSTFYSDLVERGLAARNPVKLLPRATRRLIRPAHDPRTTPFVEKLSDVRRVFLALPEPVNLAYALGALGGLRTGEVLALRWAHVDLEQGRIHVRESTGGPLKDEDSRMVPIQEALRPLLSEWRLRSGGEGQVVPPMRGGERRRCDEHTLGKMLRKALASLLGLAPVTWYQATRHTFASHWVLQGGAIEELRDIMGHSTVMVTERYAHIRPDLFASSSMRRLAVDLTAAGAKVLPMTRAETVDDEGSLRTAPTEAARETV
jgi:integrase